MYTVLIQNKKTMNIFHKYHPLFLNYLKGNVGCCRWIESGQSVDTAVPELRNVINDKEAWRAIIVRIEDEDDMQRFAENEENPYDFECDDKDDIPIVRLTQILGGYPSPKVQYKTVIEANEYGVKKTVFKPEILKEEEERYEKKIEDFEFDGKKPIEIILVTFKKGDKNRYERNKIRKLNEEPDNTTENKKTEFWERCRYSSICRFIKFNYFEEGSVQLEADMFKFWTSVMLLATNIIDPSSLQAYRLYDINVLVNKDRLYDELQCKITDMANLISYINEEIKNRLDDKQKNVNGELKYRTSVSIQPIGPMPKDIQISENTFKTIPSSVNREQREWLNHKEDTEKEFDRYAKNVERTLESSADSVRMVSKVPMGTITPIDRIQEEELQDQLFDTYMSIINNSVKISGRKKQDKEKLELKSKEVINKISGRITSPVVLEIACILCCIGIISFIPGIIFYIIMNVGKLSGSFIYLGTVLVVMMGVLFFIMVDQKLEFIKNVKAYNCLTVHSIESINSGMKKVNDFLDSIASYTRGKIFLRKMSGKKKLADETFTKLEKHLMMAQYMQGRIVAWGKGFYLPELIMDTETTDALFDTDTDPEINELYSLNRTHPFDIPLNESGVMVKSDLDFIEKLEIRREELDNYE